MPQDKPSPLPLPFQMLMEEVEYSGQMMLKVASITKRVKREGRAATAEELAQCRQLRRALSHNFRQIMRLTRHMEHELTRPKQP